MSSLTIPQKRTGDPVSKILFEKIDAAVERIRERALELSMLRGGLPEHELDDWCQAEMELFDVPAAEMVETSQGFTAQIAVPGFHAQQLNVAIDGGYLTVEGILERSQEKRGKTLVSEFSRKELFRRFALPDAVEIDQIRAAVDDGVLTITMPKQAVSAATMEKTEAEAAKVEPGKVETKKAKAAHAAA